MTNKLWMVVLLAAVASIAFSWPDARVRSDSPARPPATPAVSVRAPAPPTLSVRAPVKAAEPVEQRPAGRRLVFKADGVIEQCRVQAGDRVRKGAVLMALNNHEQEANVALAESELALARAERAKALAGPHPEERTVAEDRAAQLRENVRYLRKELERFRRVSQRSATSDQEYQQARTLLLQQDAALRAAEAEVRRLRNAVRPEDRALADARVRQAEARLEQARQRLRDTLLVAPCDGTVVKILKREGEGQRPADPEPVLLFAGQDDPRAAGARPTPFPPATTGVKWAGAGSE